MAEAHGLHQRRAHHDFALEHYAYCPRQCALIHVEQTYDENVYTLRGNRTHRRVDTPVNDARCPPCSLQSACLPDPLDDEGRQQRLGRALFTVEDD